MSASNKGPGVDSRLQNLTNALYVDGNDDIVVRTGFAGDIVISGNVNIPGEVTVNSSPDDPVHVHLTELGTFGNLTTYVPIQGNVTVTGNANVTVIGNVSGITTLPAITGNVGVSGNVSISQLPGITVTNFPAFPSNVSITSLPGITVTNFPSNVRITDLPGITGTVNIGTMPEVEIKNDTGNPIPVTGTINIQSTGNQGKLWTMQVAQGLVAGHTTVQTTGYNPTTAAGDAVWGGGTAYPWSSLTTAQTIYLKSSTNNANDRGFPILVHGLDANYNELFETVTLNASDSRTPVTTTNQFIRIHHIEVNDASDVNEGDISAMVTSGTGPVVAKMLAGRGRGNSGTFTVPAGKTGYLFKGDASSTGATVVDFYTRPFGKAFRVAHVAIVDNSTYVYDFPFPPMLPEKTDMYCKINVGSGKTAINFEVLLVDN